LQSQTERRARRRHKHRIELATCNARKQSYLHGRLCQVLRQRIVEDLKSDHDNA
jgi:hypothetical protein